MSGGAYDWYGTDYMYEMLDDAREHRLQDEANAREWDNKQVRVHAAQLVRTTREAWTAQQSGDNDEYTHDSGVR